MTYSLSNTHQFNKAMKSKWLDELCTYRHGFNRIIATIHIIPHKQVIGVRTLSINFKMVTSLIRELDSNEVRSKKKLMNQKKRLYIVDTSIDEPKGLIKTQGETAQWTKTSSFLTMTTWLYLRITWIFKSIWHRSQ